LSWNLNKLLQVAVAIRTTAHLKQKAFNQAFEERRVANRVIRSSNSACKKPDLSKDMLSSLMVRVSSDIRHRAESLANLTPDVTVPGEDDTLAHEMLSLQETTDELGLDEATGGGDSDSDMSWYHLSEVGAREQEQAVARYQPANAPSDDGVNGARSNPHQEREVTTPLGYNTVEEMQTFHRSQWIKIVDCFNLNYWLDAEDLLVELKEAATRFLGQNLRWLRKDQDR
jgi:hypothetical protein